MIICTDFFARHPYQYLKILLRNGFYNGRGFTILVIFFWIASLGQNMKIFEEFEEKNQKMTNFLLRRSDQMFSMSDLKRSHI